MKAFNQMEQIQGGWYAQYGIQIILHIWIEGLQLHVSNFGLFCSIYVVKQLLSSQERNIKFCG